MGKKQSRTRKGRGGGTGTARRRVPPPAGTAAGGKPAKTRAVPRVGAPGQEVVPREDVPSAPPAKVVRVGAIRDPYAKPDESHSGGEWPAGFVRPANALRMPDQQYDELMRRLGQQGREGYLRVAQSVEGDVLGLFQAVATEAVLLGVARGRALEWIIAHTPHGEKGNTLEQLAKAGVIKSVASAELDRALWREWLSGNLQQRIERARKKGFRATRQYCVGWIGEPTAKLPEPDKPTPPGEGPDKEEAGPDTGKENQAVPDKDLPEPTLAQPGTRHRPVRHEYRGTEETHATADRTRDGCHVLAVQGLVRAGPERRGEEVWEEFTLRLSPGAAEQLARDILYAWCPGVQAWDDEMLSDWQRSIAQELQDRRHRRRAEGTRGGKRPRKGEGERRGAQGTRELSPG
jgi:hypothetical protein